MKTWFDLDHKVSISKHFLIIAEDAENMYELKHFTWRLF